MPITRQNPFKYIIHLRDVFIFLPISFTLDPLNHCGNGYIHEC